MLVFLDVEDPSRALLRLDAYNKAGCKFATADPRKWFIRIPGEIVGKSWTGKSWTEHAKSETFNRGVCGACAMPRGCAAALCGKALPFRGDFDFLFEAAPRSDVRVSSRAAGEAEPQLYEERFTERRSLSAQRGGAATRRLSYGWRRGGEVDFSCALGHSTALRRRAVARIHEGISRLWRGESRIEGGR